MTAAHRAQVKRAAELLAGVLAATGDAVQATERPAETSLVLIDPAASVVLTPKGPDVPRAELVRVLLQLASQIDGGPDR